MRSRSGEQRVTNIELFFDLVYVFAITQLSHFLLAHPTVRGVLQAGLLPARATAPRRAGSVRYRYLSSGLAGSWVRREGSATR